MRCVFKYSHTYCTFFQLVLILENVCKYKHRVWSGKVVSPAPSLPIFVYLYLFICLCVTFNIISQIWSLLCTTVHGLYFQSLKMDSTDHVLLADLFGKKLYYSHFDFINYTSFDEDIFLFLCTF